MAVRRTHEEKGLSRPFCTGSRTLCGSLSSRISFFRSFQGCRLEIGCHGSEGIGVGEGGRGWWFYKISYLGSELGLGDLSLVFHRDNI